MRIAIAGVPKSGKTTFATGICRDQGINCMHTDDLINECEWSELSARVAEWFDISGDLIVEGVAVPRALRKWLTAHPEGKPCDEVIWMGKPFEELSKGQVSMAKGCLKVIEEIEQELFKRGVEIKQE
jgi:adenylate kinase family enzyme